MHVQSSGARKRVEYVDLGGAFITARIFQFGPRNRTLNLLAGRLFGAPTLLMFLIFTGCVVFPSQFSKIRCHESCQRPVA